MLDVNGLNVFIWLFTLWFQPSCQYMEQHFVTSMKKIIVHAEQSTSFSKIISFLREYLAALGLWINADQ